MQNLAELNEQLINNNEYKILSNKFLINDNNIKGIDINTEQIKKIDLKEINNESDFVNVIEINEILQPKIYSINSIMEYFENCIMTIYIIPSYLRYAVTNNDSDKLKKATNILSDLYNLYKSLENCKFCLISLKIEEYKYLFEIMLLNLKNAGIDFPMNFELNGIDNSIIKNFIIEPEKDNYTINKNNFKNK